MLNSILLPIALIVVTGVCLLLACMCLAAKWADVESQCRFERHAAERAARQ